MEEGRVRLWGWGQGLQDTNAVTWSTRGIRVLGMRRAWYVDFGPERPSTPCEGPPQRRSATTEGPS